MGQGRDAAKYPIKHRTHTHPKELLSPIMLIVQRLRNPDINSVY